MPQTEVLRHADLAIVHGGVGTVEECVHAGVPMLVYCGYETDMGGYAARVLYHGLGLVGDAGRDTPATMRSHIEQLLTDAQFAASVGRLRDCGAVYAEKRVAEQVVASLLAG